MKTVASTDHGNILFEPLHFELCLTVYLLFKIISEVFFESIKLNLDIYQVSATNHVLLLLYIFYDPERAKRGSQKYELIKLAFRIRFGKKRTPKKS